MAEAHEADEIFVYTGGDQVVPRDVRRVKIDKSVTIISEWAFFRRRHLIYVDFHDGIDRIEAEAFDCCFALRIVKLLGVKVVGNGAFANCGLVNVEFGDKLETLKHGAFYSCTSLRSIIMPSVRSIEYSAFGNCEQLTDLDLPEGLETIQDSAFYGCIALRRITIPLKSDMIANNVFSDCPDLTTVDLVGGIHNTIASLHLESWRNDTKEEINRINQVLPNTTSSQKTAEIQEWMRSVIRQLDHYKAQHKSLLKEATTLLELRTLEGQPTMRKIFPMQKARLTKT
jgi:hypothetical protein